MPGFRSQPRIGLNSGSGKQSVLDWNVRKRVLEYMREHPIPWRAGILARKLRTPAESTRQALSQLTREGFLVSCTVTAREQPPQEEYRIAAHTVSADLYKFVISTKSATGGPASAEMRRTTGARKTSR